MAEKSVEVMRGQILEKVRQAGAAGLTKSKVGSFKAGSAGARAFADLVREGAIQNLGSAQKSRFVVAEFFRPLELAYEAMLKRVGQEPLKPWPRAKLEAGLIGAVKARAGEALDLLVEERELMPVKFGVGRYYLAAKKIREWLGAGVREEQIEVRPGESQPVVEAGAGTGVTAAPQASLEELAARVAEAYRRVRARSGFADVDILAVREEAGLRQDQIVAVLRAMSADGRAVLGMGDASLASEVKRAAAVELLGQPHLLVQVLEVG